jgi:hypothetical protein
MKNKATKIESDSSEYKYNYIVSIELFGNETDITTGVSEKLIKDLQQLDILPDETDDLFESKLEGFLIKAAYDFHEKKLNEEKMNRFNKFEVSPFDDEF